MMCVPICIFVNKCVCAHISCVDRDLMCIWIARCVWVEKSSGFYGVPRHWCRCWVHWFCIFGGFSSTWIHLFRDEQTREWMMIRRVYSSVTIQMYCSNICGHSERNTLHKGINILSVLAFSYIFLTYLITKFWERNK